MKWRTDGGAGGDGNRERNVSGEQIEIALVQRRLARRPLGERRHQRVSFLVEQHDDLDGVELPVGDAQDGRCLLGRESIEGNRRQRELEGLETLRKPSLARASRRHRGGLVGAADGPFQLVAVQGKGEPAEHQERK